MRRRVADGVRRQLSSPTTWFAVALFALIAGVGFVTTLRVFLDSSSQALAAPPLRPINVTQQLVRPFLLYVGMAALLALPMVTAGAFKQTDDVHDAGNAALAFVEPRQVYDSFVRMLAVYAVMLVTSMPLVAVLFLFGAPEIAPIATGYLGLMLFGTAFVSVAVFVARLAQDPMAAGIATTAVSVCVIAASWLARSGDSAAQTFFEHLSVGDGLDDFARGVINGRAVVWCAALVVLGFLLARRASSATDAQG